jgi:solute carrier family 50 protein (sugar transporter)
MIHPGSILVVTINGSGTAIEFVYIILFFIFSAKKKRLIVIGVVIVELIFVALLTLLVLTLAHTYSKRSMVVGTVCILFNIMMYASPLTVMKMVITTKSVEYMPFFLSFASFANGVVWTAYACIRFDPFIAVPNGLGALFGLTQLILFATYYKSTKRQIEARKSKEIDFSEVIVAANQQPNKTATAATENGRGYENHGT